MSYIYYPKMRRPVRRHSVPWLLFGVLSVALFFIAHFPVELHKTWDDFNNQSDEVIAQDYSSGSSVRQIVLISLGVFALISLVTRRSDRRLRMDGLLSWVLVIFTGWAVLSLAWSEDPPLTLKRVAILVILSTVAVAMVQRFTLHEIVLWMFFNMASFLMLEEKRSKSFVLRVSVSSIDISTRSRLCQLMQLRQSLSFIFVFFVR